MKDTLVKELASTHAVEFLPVAIEDHTKKIVSRDYFIMHPLGMVDCIDIKKSKGKYNPLKKEMLTSCKSLVLIPDSIPDGIRLFRPKHWGFNVMVTEDFARYLESRIS